MPNAENPHNASPLDPPRVELMLQRLQQNFYEQSPASDRIAAAVLRDLQTLDERSPALPA